MSQEQASTAPSPLMSIGSIQQLDAGYQSFPTFDAWQATDLETVAWDQYFQRLTTARTHVPEARFADAVRVALRSAAIDTGALEGLYEVDRGFTFSVATEAATWQDEMAARGSGTLELFEAQLDGYELVVDLATRSLPVTEAFIRHLHEVICGAQSTYRVMTPQGPQEQALPLGAYKTHPNHVLEPDGTVHSYAPVLATPSEMHRLVEELSSAVFQSAHPVSQASFVHHALTVIHPFPDGNGRVARALASIYLVRAASLPFVVFADQRVVYLQSLRLADRGETSAFVHFVLERALDAIDVLLEQLALAAVEPLEATVESLRALVTGAGGLSHHELDAIASRLLGLVQAEFVTQIGAIELPPGMSLQVSSQTGGLREREIPEGLRPVGGPSNPVVYLAFNSTPPARAGFAVPVEAFVARDVSRHDVFEVHRPDAAGLGASLSAIHPQESTALRLRLSMWVRHALSDILVRARAEIGQSAD